MKSQVVNSIKSVIVCLPVYSPHHTGCVASLDCNAQTLQQKLSSSTLSSYCRYPPTKFVYEAVRIFTQRSQSFNSDRDEVKCGRQAGVFRPFLLFRLVGNNTGPIYGYVKMTWGRGQCVWTCEVPRQTPDDKPSGRLSLCCTNDVGSR